MSRVLAPQLSACEVTSAVTRTLRLQELIHAILVFLQLDSDADDNDEEDDDDEDFYDYSAEHYNIITNVTAQRAALFNAARVNQTWCSVALRLLWAFPGPNALNPDAVITYERRTFYAALIYKVVIDHATPFAAPSRPSEQSP